MRMRFVFAAAVLTLILGAAIPAAADTFTGTLYYTNFSGQPNVHSLNFNYNDTTSSVSLTNVNTVVGTTIGADGIIFDGHGQLLVGGQNAGHITQMRTNGTIVSVGSTSPVNAYHLALAPNGSVFGMNIPGGQVANLPVTATSLGAATIYNVVGDSASITSLAFANGQWYYTNAAPNGSGEFGTVVFGGGNATTHKLFSSNAAHGMILDPFSNDLLLFSGANIAQIDPLTNTVISTRSVAGMDFDQGSADGNGHAFIASNTGDLEFIDYRASHLIGAPSDFTHNQFLISNLDDIAPLVGLGGSSPVPLPSTAWSGIVLIGVVGGWRLWCRRLRARLYARL